MKMTRSGVLLLWVLLLAAACKKQPDPVLNTAPVIDPGGIELPGFQVQFTPVVNGAPLAMDSVWYRNASRDSFRVTEHKYYVSNFSLETDSGVVVKLPETYLLVDARDVQPRKITNVPEGTYTKISFLLGVDSVRNVSGAQTGDLEQSKGMFWNWNAGYIMAKMEGFSPQSTVAGNAFYLHIAGFSGQNNVLRTVTLPLPTPLVVKAGRKPLIQLQSDVLSWFSGAVFLSLRNVNAVMSAGPQSVAIADNYSKGFSIVRVEP